MATLHEVPAGFEAELRRRWPDFARIRFNEAVSRWEFVFKTAANTESSIFYGWDCNPLTGEALKADPVSGLLPFRDLTADAQAEIIATGERTYVANRHDGAGSHTNQIHKNAAHNRALHKKKVAARANTYADLLKEVDLRRPWVKYHPRKQRPAYS